MKTITMFYAVILTSVFAQAHVEPGSHKGKTPDGVVCEMVAGDTYFEKGERHPLNERISIVVNGDTFVVQHPPVVSIQEKLAFFNHDMFQGVLPTKTGAKALVVTMVHTQQKQGPTEFHLITHEYKTNQRSIFSCTLD